MIVWFSCYPNQHKKNKHTQVRRRLPRSCNANTKTYCEFLFEDSEGSDFANSSGEETSAEDEEYNAAAPSKTFDKRKGEKDWLGRRICKSFGENGDFDGIVYAIDDDEDNPGYKLFLVHYFDDPDDGECMWPEELNRYVRQYVLSVISHQIMFLHW